MNTRKIVPVHHKTLIRLFELEGFAVKRQKGLNPKQPFQKLVIFALH